MLARMKAYREIGFEGVLRLDHVPTVEDDSNANAGYTSFGRLIPSVTFGGAADRVRALGR